MDFRAVFHGPDVARRRRGNNLRAVIDASTQPRAALPQFRSDGVVPVAQGVI